VEAITNTAQSLSQIAANQSYIQSKGPNAATQADTEVRSREALRNRAFEKLADDTGIFLFPLTKGRDRAIVIVPSDQIPEVKYFQQWMKMATLSRILLPIGWHWQNSAYSAYYRDAVIHLDAQAITALDAKWIIVSDVFQDHLSNQVATALADRTRFVPMAAFHEYGYSMTIFGILQ